MRICRVPAVLIAVVIAGTGLTACAGLGGNSPTAASTAAAGGSATALSAPSSPSGLSTESGPSVTPATSAAATHKASPVATRSARPTRSAIPTKSVTPKKSATPGASGTHSFTVPAIPGDNVVSASGSYTMMGTARVKVTVCAKQTGGTQQVGAVAVAYNASGASKNIGAVVLTGPGTSSCGTITFLFYTAHLKVHSFIGNQGKVVKTGPILTLY